jgi:hypothetical protein
VAETWIPSLQVRETAGRCRLVLAGVTHGDGQTLQEAADDLIARLLGIAMSVRSSGFRLATELGPPDRNVLGFLWELGEIAARGEDIRNRVFGPPPEATA